MTPMHESREGLKARIRWPYVISSRLYPITHVDNGLLMDFNLTMIIASEKNEIIEDSFKKKFHTNILMLSSHRMPRKCAWNALSLRTAWRKIISEQNVLQWKFSPSSLPHSSHRGLCPRCFIILFLSLVPWAYGRICMQCPVCQFW